MGFLRRLFKTNKNIIDESEFDILDRQIDDKEERKKYVSSSLMQMKELSSEIDNLRNEYNVVTGYLNDCDEIDRLPADIGRTIDETVQNILKIREEKNRYFLEEPLIDDVTFEKTERIADEMPEAYDKIADAEDFQIKIKNDLKRVENEKQSFMYRRAELNAFINNITGILVIATTAAIICMVLLLIMMALFEMDVKVGFLLTVTILIAVYCFIFLKGYDLKKELKRIDKTMIKIIGLQNTVKIRLVNNTNLLDYLYIKYDIYSSDELKERYDLYLREKERREKYEKASVDLPAAKRELLMRLKKLPLKDPMLWVHSPEALVDKNERVEMRHELISRRQKIRSQIDENTAEAEKIKNRLKDMINRYPKYSVELMNMMDDFD